MKRINYIKQRGSTVLVAVMSLLVGMTLLSFFTNRSLMFEQKTSANQTRSTKAMEAAEAGLEWAIANLNSYNRIDTSCATSSVTANPIFRDKYLLPDAATGTYSATFSTITPGCVRTSSGLSCTCPTAGTPNFGSNTGPAFTVQFLNVAGQTMMAEVVSTGCTTPEKPCVSTATNDADSTATVRQIVLLQSALATPPAAALTAQTTVTLSGSVVVKNTDTATNGITINSGAGTTLGGSSSVSTVAGAPTGASVVDGDTSLSTLTDEKMFQTFFGQTKDAFKNAPTTTVINCSSGCGNSDVTTKIDAGARVLWLEGDVTINASTILGSATSPIILIVDGTAYIRGNSEVYGVVYSTAQEWDEAGTGNSKIYGAAIAEGSFKAQGNGTYAYDPKVLSALKSLNGQFAKVPGSWRDF